MWLRLETTIQVSLYYEENKYDCVCVIYNIYFDDIFYTKVSLKTPKKNELWQYSNSTEECKKEKKKAL